jgi:ParB-like chromosome segregation protein Spo0J
MTKQAERKTREDFKPEIIWLAPDQLTPYQNNTKQHPTDQIDKIAQQIAYVGFTQPILVDKHRVIIAGHGRREASIRLGLKQVPVIVASHLSEYEVKAARIADNRVAESPWDADLLKFELGTLQAHDFDLNLTGFSLDQIDGLLKNRDASDSEGKKTYENSNQFIVTVHCKNENEMRELYDELRERDFECKLIT